MGSKFEMEHLHKMTMTEESPFYGMVYWYTGRYGKNVERKMTVFFDKINKSILFVPKMKMDTTLTLDGEKISELCSTTPRPRSTSNSSTAQTLTPRTTSMRRSGSTLCSAVSSARLTSRGEVCPHTTTMGSTAGSTTPTSLRSSPTRRPTRRRTAPTMEWTTGWLELTGRAPL